MARTVQELEAEKREWDLLFAQEAWKKLIHLKQEVVKNLSEGWEEKFTTDEQLHMARGYIKALKMELLSLENIIEANFNLQMEEAQTNSAEIPSEDVL